MEQNQPKELHPLLLKVIERLVTSGAGEVYMTSDGHLFIEACECFEAFWGAMDMKKEGRKHGVRIVVRKVTRRAGNSKYADMPLLQIYVLPIVEKTAATMTDAERQNIEMNTRALKMAHAVERDTEQSAHYHTLHEAHKLNPVGYKKCYRNFFGFLVATFRLQLEAEVAAKEAAKATSNEALNETSKEATGEASIEAAEATAIEAAQNAVAGGIMPCVVSSAARSKSCAALLLSAHAIPLPHKYIPSLPRAA